GVLRRRRQRHPLRRAAGGQGRARPLPPGAQARCPRLPAGRPLGGAGGPPGRGGGGARHHRQTEDRRETMKFALVVLAVAVLGGAALASAQEGAVVGKAAPDFTLTDSNGKAHTLSAYKGKTVVLEWVNFGCPFVGKHYGSGNMQKLQKSYTGKGVVWLSVS